MPRAVRFNPQPIFQHPNPSGDRLRGILKHNSRRSVPGMPSSTIPRQSRTAAIFPGANPSNTYYPDDQHHCQCCRYNIGPQQFPATAGPPFPVPHDARQPIQPQTWLHPTGNLQWTPNTFTGANSTIPLPPAEPASWASTAAPDVILSHINLNPIFCNSSINWDVSRRSSTANQQGNRAALTALLSSPALQPEFRKITIDVGTDAGITGWAFVWGRLRVKAEDPAGITAKDVMDAIYTYFHTPLSVTELEMVHHGDRQAITQAQALRINSRRSRRRLVDPGPLRVDLLLGHRYFESLTVVSFQGRHCKVALRLKSNPEC